MDPISLSAGAISGALVSALVTEVILAAKKAYRCKDYCKNLQCTLEAVEPLVVKVAQSSDKGDATCQAWITSVHALLVEAKGLTVKCSTESGLFKSVKFLYVNRKRLSSSLAGIDNRIKDKVVESNLLTLDTAQVTLGIVQKILSRQCMVSAVVDKSAASEMQPVPSITVAFENNPFKKLKEVIICVADAPFGEAVTVGLKGGGGAGKTLLAKMVNNDKDIQQKYGAGSILWITIGHDASVSSTYKTMAKFLKGGDVFEREYAHRNLEDQRRYLMEAFKMKRTLLILDDVWENSRNNRAMIHWLDISKGCGSTTLITTRNGSVLDRAKAKERIEVLSLSKEENWKLFCYHAFEATIPPSAEFENTAKKICEECKGLPLALEVIGGALWGKKDVRDWESALCRLKNSESMCNSRSMDDELFHHLKFSYDELKEETKRCFLYFAAFPEDYWISTEELCSIWHAEKLFSYSSYEDKYKLGRENLVALADRSLIDLEKDGKYARIHDVLRDLAICIIREARAGEWAFECHFEPGKVLEIFPKMKETTKRVSFVGSTIKHCEASYVLQVPYMEVCLLSDLSMPNDGFCIPYAFSKCMNALVYLDISRCSDLKELPESIKELKSLVHLDLSGCWGLKELPKSIGELKSLMHLNLSYCWGLQELLESIGELKSLVHLDLSKCWGLKELLESIKELKSLVHLDLSECWGLKELPESIGELKSLVHLDLSKCFGLKELPKSIGELKSLMHLNLSYCWGLQELPESIGELKSLVHLDLSKCWGLKELPESIGELKSLVHLDLSECWGVKELPESIGELKSLVHLDLSKCWGLKELPESIKELKSLVHLDLSKCIDLKELPESIGELKSIVHFDLSWCRGLKELPESIGELKSLVHLDLSGCQGLKELPESIKELKSLAHLDLSKCINLKELLESIKELKSLGHLDLSGCRGLKELPESIGELKSLMHLDLSECSDLKELPESIKNLKCIILL